MFLCSQHLPYFLLLLLRSLLSKSSFIVGNLSFLSAAFKASDVLQFYYNAFMLGFLKKRCILIRTTFILQIHILLRFWKTLTHYLFEHCLSFSLCHLSGCKSNIHESFSFCSPSLNLPITFYLFISFSYILMNFIISSFQFTNSFFAVSNLTLNVSIKCFITTIILFIFTNCILILFQAYQLCAILLIYYIFISSFCNYL